MVKNYEHAKRIQYRRIAAGKTGYSKAVLRFCKKDRLNKEMMPSMSAWNR